MSIDNGLPVILRHVLTCSTCLTSNILGYRFKFKYRGYIKGDLQTIFIHVKSNKDLHISQAYFICLRNISMVNDEFVGTLDKFTNAKILKD
mgnify:CR=1 FL=1